MTDVAGHELARTYYCTVPGCTNEARSDRGLYSKCDEHRKANVGNRSDRKGGASTNGNGTLAQRIAKLSTLARNVDKAKAAAKKKTEQVLAAKKHADELERELRMEMRAFGLAEERE